MSKSGGGFPGFAKSSTRATAKVNAYEGWGEGEPKLAAVPPHPVLLPKGEREQTEFAERFELKIIALHLDLAVEPLDQRAASVPSRS